MVTPIAVTLLCVVGSGAGAAIHERIFTNPDNDIGARRTRVTTGLGRFVIRARFFVAERGAHRNVLLD